MHERYKSSSDGTRTIRVVANKCNTCTNMAIVPKFIKKYARLSSPQSPQDYQPIRMQFVQTIRSSKIRHINLTSLLITILDSND